MALFCEILKLGIMVLSGVEEFGGDLVMPLGKADHLAFTAPAQCCSFKNLQLLQEMLIPKCPSVQQIIPPSQKS